MHVFLGKRNEFSQDVNSNEERIEIERKQSDVVAGSSPAISSKIFQA